MINPTKEIIESIKKIFEPIKEINDLVSKLENLSTATKVTKELEEDQKREAEKLISQIKLGEKHLEEIRKNLRKLIDE
jgi:dsDNA-specific endonuclease/ATPase MutS2